MKNSSRETVKSFGHSCLLLYPPDVQGRRGQSTMVWPILRLVHLTPSSSAWVPAYLGLSLPRVGAGERKHCQFCFVFSGI